MEYSFTWLQEKGGIMTDNTITFIWKEIIVIEMKDPEKKLNCMSYIVSLLPKHISNNVNKLEEWSGRKIKEVIYNSNVIPRCW